MKVKIIKAPPDKWYHYLIGEIFEVTTNYPVFTYLHNYWIIDEGQNNSAKLRISAKLLLEEDCEVVKEIVKENNPITKFNEEKPKMKKVVKEYSKEFNDQIITFGMLLAKGACKESLDWIVQEINKLNKTEIEMTLDQFITWLIDNNRSSDASWAEKNFWNKDTNIEEVLVKDIDLQNKIYAFAYGKNIYKYFKLDLVNNLWINISTSRKYSNIDIQTIEDHTIYEFENQQEFFKWALESINGN